MRFHRDYYSHLAAYGRGQFVGEEANLDERRERRRLRDRLAEIRKHVNAVRCAEADIVDVPPFRPRRNAIWLA
ncbi:hypothetical protein [Microtetraspora fusca]|uniref:hypothetical protein n=1 Tax=Microtetraspora fusca TaxID=1997 RepID=UPI0009FFE363|nr:hypothetical protein [Microtetraspora fusca]